MAGRGTVRAEPRLPFSSRPRRACLDFGRRKRHYDRGRDPELAGGQRDALRVVARRARDDARLHLLAREVDEFVVRAANLEGEDWLQVFALQPDLVPDHL